MNQTIEVGDTVRMECSCHNGKEATVVSVIEGKSADVKPAGYGYPASTIRCGLQSLTLIRKARKPEQKKEATMSKKPELSEINERTLVKMRDCGMCACIHNGNEYTFNNKERIANGSIGTLSAQHNFTPDLHQRRLPEPCKYDIVAYKRCDSVLQAINHVMNNDEPAWDWMEDMDKPEFKVGDWVEVLGTSGNCMSGFFVGDRCKVIGFSTSAPEVHVDRNGWTGWANSRDLKPCPPPAPVDVTQEELLRQYDKGAGVRLVLKSQSIEVK